MKHSGSLRYMLLTLLVSMLGIGSASAQQAYAVFTESTATLTFRYDKNFANYDYQTGGHAYLLNTGSNDPGWYTDGSCNKVEIVSFDPSFATVRPTTTYRWFYYMENLSEIFGLENLNTSEVTNMDWMFSHCNLNILKNLTFDTRNVTTMRGMYAYSSGTSFSMNLDTRNVTDMSRMFFNCKQLNILDLSTINTSNVAVMSNMFRGCEKLKTIYVGYEWNQSRAGEHQDMFEGCYAIVGGAGTTYNPQGTDKAFAHVDLGGANPGYLTLNDQYAAYDSGSLTLTFYCDTNMGERRGILYYLKRIDAAPAWGLDGKNKLVQYVVFDPSFADARPTGIRRWFWEMEKLEAIAGIRENLDLGEETDLSYMFYGCSALKNVDLSLFDMRNVTSMSSMFAGCSSLTTIYVGKDWNTDMVTSSSNMFAGCTSLVGGQGTTFDANHTDKTYARPDGGAKTPGYLTLGSPYVVINNDVMTFYCDTERSTRSGKTYSLNMGEQSPGWLGTFVHQAVFDPSFAAARPSTTVRWFSGQVYMESIQGMNEYLNTSEVTNMSSMFYFVAMLTTLDLKGFNTEKVTDMSRMFQACSNLQALNLSSFDTYRVQNVNSMFANCSLLKIIYVGDRWNLDGASVSEEMFWDCTALVGGKGTTYTKVHRDKAYAHVDGGPDNPGYLTTMVPYVVYNDGTLSFYKDMYVTIRPGTAYLLNTGLTPDWYDDKNYKNVTSVVFDPSFADARPTRTSGWFLEMSNLKSITGMKKYLNTSKVESMFGMFYGCKLLESIELNNFDTQKVTMMNSMFYGCTSLKTLDLSSFNTASATDIAYMFSGCSNLKTIYVGEGWDAQTIMTTYQMFKDCTSLVGGAGTTYDAEHTDGAYAHIDGGTSNPGYLTFKGNLKGDVNNDGQVGIGDIVAVTNVMAGIETDPDIIARADVNDDDQVGIGDIVAITNIMAGIGTTPEPESVKTYTVNGVTFTMVNVEGGTFQMGSTDGESNEQPVHSVTLSSFSIGQTEVTQQLWYAVMGQKPTTDGKQWESDYGLGDQYPAYYVSWNDCQLFITKLNMITGHHFRLPTEAEWEFAARGGNSSKGYTYAGGNGIGGVAWYRDNSYSVGSSSPDYGTHAVATKQANELGLYDMSGNVWEWCQDWYDNYSSEAQTNPTGAASGSNRVFRGGGWFYYASQCRVAYRGRQEPALRRYDIGFRLAL